MISPAELKDILEKVAYKQPLTLYEQDEYRKWQFAQVDQVAAIKNLENTVQQQQAVMGSITQPGQQVTKLSQISKDLGDVIAGRFIAPATASTSTEPTNAGFIGSFMSGDGETFNGEKFGAGGANSGVLQWGGSNETGKLIGAAGAVIIDSDGLTIQADETEPYVTFKDENGDTIAVIFQDGVGNLQFNLSEDDKAIDFNNVAGVNSGNATGKNAGFYLFENRVRKAGLVWGASNKDTEIENYTATGDIVLVLKDSTSSGVFVRDDDAEYNPHGFLLNGNYRMRESAADPDYIDNYAILYYLDTGSFKIRHKQGAVETEIDLSAIHTQGTDTALGAVGTKNPPIDADKVIYRDSTDSDALVTSTWTQVKAFLKTYLDALYIAISGNVSQANLEELTDASETTLHSHAGAGGWDGDITDIDVASSADIGEALVGTDQVIVYNASSSTWVRAQAIRLLTYISATNKSAGLVMIEDKVLASDAAPLTFSSIPAGYKALVIDFVTRSNSAGAGGDAFWMHCNNDGGANYDYLYCYDNGVAGRAYLTAVGSTAPYITGSPKAGDTAGYVSQGRIIIPNYAGATFYKQWQMRTSVQYAAATNSMFLIDGHGTWKSASAITRLDFDLASGDEFLTGSRFTLYGQL